MGWSNQENIISDLIQQSDGSLQQVELGSYPVMGEKESDEALEAAVRAYNNGRGEWPMMKVGERIACMQNFIQRMVEQRDLIIKLIMWEIGKSLADSEKSLIVLLPICVKPLML